MNIEKNTLIEMMSELFRKMHHVSPMAAKILSVLVIEGCAEGLTFEYLIERVQASKSTLSTNINFLLDKGLIYYDTKEGKRRKYFKSFPFDKRFSGFLELIRAERDFTLRFRKYISEQDPLQQDEFAKKRIRKTGILLDYLGKMESLTEDFLEKLKQEDIREKL